MLGYREPGRLTTFKRVAGRGGWGIADQSFSSLTNFALSVFIARSVSPAEFGVFTLAFTSYAITLGASQALTAQPLAIRFSNCSVREWRDACRLATGAGVVLGAFTGCICVLIGILIEPLRGPMLALGLVMPTLLLQDSWRFAFFSAGRPFQAFVNDLVWAVCLIPAFGWLMWTGNGSVTSFVLAWGGAATVAAIAGAIQARIIPAPLEARTWWRDQKDIALGLTGDFIVNSGSARITVFSVAAIAGLPATGAMRGANMLLTPLRIFFTGLAPVKVPEAVRILSGGTGPDALKRYAVRLSAAFTTLVIFYGLTLLAFPDSLGSFLLEDTWEGTKGLLFVAALALAGTTVSNGAVVGLMALGSTQRLFRISLFVGPFTTAGSVLGAVTAGARGAFLGQAITYWLSAVLYWHHLDAALLERRQMQAKIEEEKSETTVKLGIAFR